MLAHPFLRRSSTLEEIQAFKRRVPPRPSQSQKRRTSSISSYHDDHGGYGLSPTSCEGSYQSPPDPYQHHLLPDVDEEKPTVFPSPPNPGPQYGASSPESVGEYQMHIGGRPILQQTHYAAPAMPATIGPASSHLLMRDSMMPPGTPASAPAHTASFPANMHVAQGHSRTRSVQGEPPSASLFSPTTPAGHQSWSMSQVEPQLRRDGSAPPIKWTTLRPGSEEDILISTPVFLSRHHRSQ
jgi:hypothetical protein